ncbi:MAG TPA: S8 family serine peptidase [Pyrinomonadaceae bacterium]
MARSDAIRGIQAAPPNLWETIKPDTVWEGRTGRGVRIAVVDSGVDAAHPALKGKVKASVEAATEGGRVTFRPSKTGDAAGHGTACAGIITMVAPDAELYSIKVLGANASGSGEMFLAGLDYAIRQRMQIINLSLGTTKPQYHGPLHDLLDRAYHAGCVVVAAANNLPQPSFPSIFSSSLVSVVKDDSTDPFTFSYRYGEVIEIVAPGVQVRTTWPGGLYRQLTGNSFACPHIVGIIALIMEAYPDLTPFQIKTILYAIAHENRKTKRV